MVIPWFGLLAIAVAAFGKPLVNDDAGEFVARVTNCRRFVVGKSFILHEVPYIIE